MKTTLRITIETPDLFEVFPEEGQTEAEFPGPDGKIELAAYRRDYAEQVHRAALKVFENEEYYADAFLAEAEEVLWDGAEYSDFNINRNVQVDPKVDRW